MTTELEKFDEKHENASEILAKVTGKEFTPVDESKYRVCPVCGAIMVKMGAAHGGVQIDVCNRCGAKFLDHGELEKIRKASDKEYRESSQYQVASEQLEKLTEAETIGSLGTFVRDYVKITNGRQLVEDFIRKFV